MAVELKFSICEASNCKSINFRELTEQYDATTNTGGWGTPNEETTDATSAVLIFKSPSGVTYSSIDLLALGFPKVNEYDQLSILASTVDSGLTEFEDGFWTVSYVITTSTTTYSQTQTFFFYCKVKKLVCDAVADLDPNDCECDPEKVNRVLQMNAFLCSLQYSVQLGDLNSALEIFELLKNLIDCSICK